MSSARERIFSTPELIEAILVQLTPIYHLLQAQRISHVFHATITSSPSLQALLFFRPSTTTNSTEWTINPLLRKHFLPWFILPESRWSMPSYKSLAVMDWTPTPERREAFLRPEASWRKMLFVQPPPKQLKVARHTSTQGGDDYQESFISMTGGVTMAPLYDLAEWHVRHQLVSSFGVSLMDVDASSAPKITLYLVSTMQCCPYKSKRQTFKSLGEGGRYDQRSLKWNQSKDKVWKTSLTEDRGGVGSEEWEARTEREVSVLEEESEEDDEDW